MNNFRNPYVDPDSIQGKVYDYYRNSTNPHSIHFSIDNQGGSEQKETQQNQKNDPYDQTKKHSIYINHQLEKITDSKPVLFSPPKVDSIQKSLDEDPIDELAFNIAQSKNIEDEKIDKKEVVSNLIKEFSLMLDDTPSIHEEFTTLQAGKIENDSLLNSDEGTSISENKLGDEYTNDTDNENVTENRIHTKHENSEMLFDEFHSMLDERNNHLISDGENIESLNENPDPMADKFFTMLSESDELQEEKQDSNTNEAEIETLDENPDPMADKFFTMLSKSDELQEEKQDSNTNEAEIETLDENSDPMADKFFTMLSESDELQEEKQDSNTKEAEIEMLNENPDSMANKFFTMLSESDELQEEKQDSNTNEADIEMLNENPDSMADKFFTMLSESDELQGEKQDSLFTTLKETKSNKIEDLTKDELHLCHKKPSFKKEKKRNYYLNKNNPYNIACLKEIDDESFFRKNTQFIDLVEKKKTATVKMPVLLTKLETEIDIIETIDLLMPLENILKVEWSIQSLDCKVVLPSKTVFLKGEFIAEIEFSNKGLENKIQSLKVSIPWSKTTNINWITVPDFSHSSQNEFMFRSQHEHDPSFHCESYHKFAEPIHSQLNQINYVWYQELNSKDKHLQVNGVAQMSVHFMQEQYVELDCYSK